MYDSTPTRNDDAAAKPQPHLQTLDRQDEGLSYNHVGAWLRPRIDTALIPSRTVEGFLMGQPELHEALTTWAKDRWPMPGNAQPYAAVVLTHVTPSDLHYFVRDRDAGKHASLLIDGRILYSLGYRPHQIGERYHGEMICGLLIRWSPEGGYDFGIHT